MCSYSCIQKCWIYLSWLYVRAAAAEIIDFRVVVLLALKIYKRNAENIFVTSV